MAGTIKGITIEIDGKVGPLKKSLADANKSIKDTQKQLRDVNKLLKLDPKNTELLKQNGYYRRLYDLQYANTAPAGRSVS